MKEGGWEGRRKEGRREGGRKEGRKGGREKGGKKVSIDVPNTIFYNSKNLKPLKYPPIMNRKLVTYMV